MKIIQTCFLLLYPQYCSSFLAFQFFCTLAILVARWHNTQGHTSSQVANSLGVMDLIPILPPNFFFLMGHNNNKNNNHQQNDQKMSKTYKICAFESYSLVEQNVYNIAYSQAVTHPSTNATQCCLTSVIGRELVLST